MINTTEQERSEILFLAKKAMIIDLHGNYWKPNPNHEALFKFAELIRQRDSGQGEAVTSNSDLVDNATLLNHCLKPNEIAGSQDVQHKRITELLRWFVRLADKKANPKWLYGHAFELAYYIKMNSGNIALDLHKFEMDSWKKAFDVTNSELDMMIRHNIIKADSAIGKLFSSAP